MTTIVLDGLNEEDFRRSIENRLREGRPGAAIARLRALLAPYAGPGRILPERFLTIEPADLSLGRWDALGDAVGRHDRPGRPVTALSIAFGWPGEDTPEPDAAGCLRPHVEISYYSDDAYPFSQSGRDDLLEGYSFYGCTWSGDCEATDNFLSLEGVDDLHGALAMLEARLLASDEPDEDHIRAGSLGACLLSALLVQAVTDRIARDGLPRPLCVTAGSSGVYPYFDAPVAGISEGVRKAAEVQSKLTTIDHGVPGPRYSSLLMTGIPRARKRAVLVLDESDDEQAHRIASLRGLDRADGENGAVQGDVDPADPGLEQPEALPAALANGPLLAKKPTRQAWDFRDMLGPRDPGLARDEAPPRDRIELTEPALPPAPSRQPIGPGFTLLEPDMQQRLQTLLSGHIPSVAEAASTPRPMPGDQPAPKVPVGPSRAEDGSVAAAVVPTPADTITPTGVRARLRAWFQCKANACLARFGR